MIHWRDNFTPRELALHNIDVENLTDETLERIIQMAMESNEAMVMKRRRMEDGDCVGFAGFLTNTSMEPSTSTSAKRALVTEDHHIEPPLSLIGTEVEIKRGGKVYSATIKYCRQSSGYKVQFSDGHFEWVSEDEIRLLPDENTRKRTDHESYSEKVGAISSGPVDEDTISKTINGRRCISQIPGIKITSANGFHKEEEPNFCCVVCDQKVYQKEPQYIVIRIPACDRCAEQKMILLDGNTKDCEAQTCTSVLKSDHCTANVANDEQRRN
ncbi:hypothetical protein DINM_007043 [Dirofilaria immitis]|nr:hypothetical protein [Dirofilaria immitis]